MRLVAWGAGGFAKQPFGHSLPDVPDQGHIGGVLHLPRQGLPRSGWNVCMDGGMRYGRYGRSNQDAIKILAVVVGP